MTVQKYIDQIVKETKRQKILADYRAGKKILLGSTHTGELCKNWVVLHVRGVLTIYVQPKVVIVKTHHIVLLLWRMSHLIKSKEKTHKEIMDEKSITSREKFDKQMKGSLFSEFDKLIEKKRNEKSKEIDNIWTQC